MQELSIKEIENIYKDKELSLFFTEYILINLFLFRDDYQSIKKYMKNKFDLDIPVNFFKMAKDVLYERNWITKDFKFTNKGKMHIKEIKKRNKLTL